MKTYFKKAIIWLPLVLAFSIISLELYTQYCNCDISQVNQLALTIPICENALETFPFEYDAEQQRLIDEIRNKRNNGESVTKEEYRTAMDLLVYEVPPELLGRANGVVCRGGVAFVSDSLPTQAKLYVARHELEHLFQTTAENQEVEANIAAGKEYPLGLLSTSISSLIKARSHLSWCCFLKSSWFAFKLYFLGIGG